MAEVTPPLDSAIAPAPRANGHTRHTRWFLVFYYLLAELSGVRSIWYWRPSRLDFLVPPALAVALGLWVVADARRRGRPIPMFVQKWFVLLAPVLAPAYIIWSRRWRGVGWLTLHAALWYALATVTMHVGGVLVFGREWLRAFGL
jgi:hypothetical protein